MQSRTRISKKTTLGLAGRRAAREPGWSLLIIGILTSGFGTWILVPSIGTSLQNGLISYENGIATYIAIQPTGICSAECYKTIPQEAISAVSSIQGVQAFYPFTINGTYFVARNFTTVENGQTLVIPRARFGVTSSVFGGPYGFPSSLLALSSGKLPGKEPSFVYQLYVPTESNFPPQILVGLNKTVQAVIGCLDCTTGNITTVGNYFNATGVGIISSNFLFNGVAVMWNSTFITSLLGQAAYNQTFGSGHANYMIVKVDSVADVPRVASELTSILKTYPPFQLFYDEAFAENAQSFVSHTAPLYQVFGATAVLAVTAVTFSVSRFVASKRSWEVGMLLTQGWSWGRITLFMVSYFMFLSLVSFALAAIISAAASQFFKVNFLLYGQSVSLTASDNPVYLATGSLLALLTPPLAAWTLVRRVKNTGLDLILREY